MEIPHVDRPEVVESTSTDVWENLQEIFADIDAHSEGVDNKVLLKKPIMHLRQLLQLHSDIRAEENELDKSYLGVLYEREWYLRKLQAIEAAVGPPASGLRIPLGGGEGSSGSLNSAALSRSIRSILYEDSEDFSLIGSKWR
ncbi:hypothetical protein O6H91_12G029000 [Diphasiastrum complanatum]|uniref:Uncharacterized protein n=2 Tax=Diphasiastrum complanatum TaxID=34168 RepID=A0ACC2C059_DIPCM|nr:hypothetical protein O6H91_12G028800 [Diphasiastrum complanatum]KAJ7535340.1 hypothetical protein O6H91_12G029000 [Diphasiastrum complanatum]